MARHIILPTRILTAAHDGVNPESLGSHSIAVKQTKNLIRKVEMLSRLFPGGRTYSEDFAAGRLLVLRADTVPNERAWEFAGKVIAQTGQRVGLRVVSQPDYDQKMYQHTFASYYDALPLQAIHDPTAKGTVLAFKAACNLSGVQFSNSSFGILGMGNLGTRIAKGLLYRGVPRIIICDQDTSRLSSYSTKRGYQVVRSSTELCEARPKALVLCAHSGSLSREFANIIVQQHAIRIVGGPEAGLDHDIGAMKILDRAGLDFVPSMLCGALGLAMTLEESIGVPPHTRTLEARFAKFLENVVQEARGSGTRFHHAFRSLISSGPRIGT